MASEQNKFTREEVYLAALLHDIGKFWQRADENGATKSKLLSDYFKNKIVNDLCPKNEKGYSHKHVLWTAQFFETHNNVFKNLIKSKAEINYGDLMLLSARHHNPTTVFEKIIQKADHYSAGMDRTKENGWKDAAEENDEKWDAFKRIQARPIFSVIGDNINTNLKAPVSPLSLNDEFITYKETEYDYNKLWCEFTSEFKFIQNANFKAFVETLISLLEKYTTRIPASTIELPDVSLYDHLKTTAAFALCLYDYIEDKSNFRLIPSQEEKPFLLLGGDLSGIQKFIYTITPRRASKNLKGRSFYLQLLINNIVNFYTDELNLFSSNIIYQSGGAFYIIAPNNKNTIEKINKISKEIEIRLFNYHSTDIYLATDYIEFGEKELFENIGEIWYQLTEKLGYKKGHRFENIIKDKYSLLFQPDNKSGADARRDYITGEPLTGDGIPLEKDNNETLVNSYTYKQIELGQKLRDADFWIQSKVIIDYWKNDFFDPVGLGYYNYFISLKEIKHKEELLKASADKIRIKRINNLNFLEPIQKGIENIYGFCFYGGNDYPKENEQPKLFEELAGIKFKDIKKENILSSPDLVRLGILRMDVDNLGAIFKKGFRNEIKPSFSRYSTLSRNLDIFFIGYINTLWNSKEEYKNYTQIIYSGGDDLFIIGKWDILISLAIDIYRRFKKWTCNNTEFGISGGIAVVPPKFPLLKAALLAEEAEKEAKKHAYVVENVKKEKNSFSLFNFSFRWDEELNEVINLKNEIKELLTNNKISKSFPSDMFNLMDRAFPESKPENFDENFKHRVKWLIAYNFKRSIQRKKEDETKEFFNKWANSVFTGKVDKLQNSKYDALQILAFASRWADYETRS